MALVRPAFKLELPFGLLTRASRMDDARRLKQSPTAPFTYNFTDSRLIAVRWVPPGTYRYYRPPRISGGAAGRRPMHPLRRMTPIRVLPPVDKQSRSHCQDYGSQPHVSEEGVEP